MDWRDVLKQCMYGGEDFPDGLRRFVDAYKLAGITGDDVDDDADPHFSEGIKYAVRCARLALTVLKEEDT